MLASPHARRSPGKVWHGDLWKKKAKAMSEGQGGSGLGIIIIVVDVIILLIVLWHYKEGIPQW